MFLICSTLAFSGCANDNEELIEKIEQLQEQVEDLQKQLNDQSKKLDELVQKSYKGEFYSLWTAFDKGFITETQIKCVSYYAYNHSVYEVAPDEENWRDTLTWKEIEFTPTVPLKDLSENMERHIKTVYYNYNIEMQERGLTVDDVILHCYGLYNGRYYVVKITPRDVAYTAEVNFFRYGNTVIW
ncbi:MAG: hypothetical protein K2I17_05865, partial [Clostridia bacterium]|nr:hypothetical protein [Clostridia bacterium]